MIDTVLLNGLWQGALIVAVATAIATFVPRRDAATRYIVWSIAMLALAIVPVLSLWHLQSATLPVAIQSTAATPSMMTSKAANASGMWLTLLWLAGVLFGFLRIAVSYVRIARILRDAKPAPEIGAGVVVSENLAFPIATGFNASRIVIPAHVAATLERSELDAIVQHERAHLARHDVAANLIAKMIEALLFFNPWAYVIGAQLVREREAACDDFVVSMTHDARQYAHCLARLAEAPRGARVTLLTPSAVGSRQLLIARIERLLSGDSARRNLNATAIVAGLVAFSALAATLIVTNAHVKPVAKSTDSTTSCTVANSPATVTNAMPPNLSSPVSHHVEAWVQVIINPYGEVTGTKVLTPSGDPAFDQATQIAAQTSQYRPQMVGCKAVTGTYNFRAEANPY